MPYGTCIAAGCEALPVKKNMCYRHFMQAKNGPIELEQPPERMPRSYEGAHARVRKLRGKASDHKCVSCGQQAAHWAYDHTDPNQAMGSRGLWYSVDVARYNPLCRKCHAYFDSAYRQRPTGRGLTPTGRRSSRADSALMYADIER